MSIISEIARLNAAKAAIITAIENKGVEVPAGTSIDGLAALIESIYGGDKVYYGTCPTSAGSQEKGVTINGVTAMTEGLSIRVKFSNAQTYNGTPRLNLNGLGAKDVKRSASKSAAQYEWAAGEVLDLVYDGSAWIIVNGGCLKFG